MHAPVTLDERADLTDLVNAWGRSLDQADAGLLESILTEQATVDLGPAIAKIGLEFPVMTGRSTIVPSMIGAVGPLDTAHLVSNLHFGPVQDGVAVHVDAYALAQHYLPGEGSDPAATRRALMGNVWKIDAVRDDASWRISSFVMDNLWFEGDPTVLLAAVSA